MNIFLTEPYGLYFQYKAVVIGEGEDEIEPILQKKYRANITVDEGIKFGLQTMKEFLKENFNFERVDAAYVDNKTRRFKKLNDDELKAAMK